MYIYIYTFIYIWINIYVYINGYVYICIYMYRYRYFLYIYILWIDVYICIYIYICASHVYMICIYIYIHLYVCMFTPFSAPDILDGRSGVWTLGGGGGCRFEMKNHLQPGGPETSSAWKSCELHPVSRQYIAKANPTPAQMIGPSVIQKVISSFSIMIHSGKFWSTRFHRCFIQTSIYLHLHWFLSYVSTRFSMFVLCISIIFPTFPCILPTFSILLLHFPIISLHEPWSKVLHFGNPIILAYGKAYATLTFSNVLLTSVL